MSHCGVGRRYTRKTKQYSCIYIWSKDPSQINFVSIRSFAYNNVTNVVDFVLYVVFRTSLYVFHYAIIMNGWLMNCKWASRKESENLYSFNGIDLIHVLLMNYYDGLSQLHFWFHSKQTKPLKEEKKNVSYFKTLHSFVHIFFFFFFVNGHDYIMILKSLNHVKLMQKFTIVVGRWLLEWEKKIFF